MILHGKKIKLYLTLLVLFLHFFSIIGYSGIITIYGSAADYKNDSIEIYYFPDLVTGISQEIGALKVDADGNFRFNFKSESILKIYADLGKYIGYLYVEPNNDYEIALPPKSPKTTENILNPYFKPQEIHFGVLNRGKTGLNYLIQKFDLLYTPYFNNYAMHLNANRPINTLKQFKRYTDSVFLNVQHSYFQDYKAYKLSMLGFMKFSGKKERDFYSRFPANRLQYNNPGFIDLFSQVFNRFLYYCSILPEGEKIKYDINVGKSYSKLRSTIINMDLFYNDTLVELAILKGVYDEFYQNEFSQENLLVVLDSLKENALIEKHRKIAGNIYWKVNRLRIGNHAPDIQLYDSNIVLRTLDDFPGKYIYLNFSSFRSYACQIQFPLLRELSEKYKHELVIITISVDESVEQMISILRAYNYNWVFLHYGHQQKLLDEYDVRGYPTYFFLDRDGTILSSPALSPVEGFDSFFENVLREKD